MADDRGRGRRRDISFETLPSGVSEEDATAIRRLYDKERRGRDFSTVNRLAISGGYKNKGNTSVRGRGVSGGQKGIAGQIERLDDDSQVLHYWYPDKDGKMVLQKGKRSRRGSPGTQSGRSLATYINRNDGGIAKKTRNF